MRHNTHAAKNRSAVSGGGKQLMSKGTGRARQGRFNCFPPTMAVVVLSSDPLHVPHTPQVAKEGLPFGISRVTKGFGLRFGCYLCIVIRRPKTKEFKAVLNNLNVGNPDLWEPPLTKPKQS